MDKSKFAERFCRRVQLFREAADWTQDDIAQALGIPRVTYSKYEIRSPLPHHLLTPFAQLCGTTVLELLAVDAPVPLSLSDDAVGLAYDINRLPEPLRDSLRDLVNEMSALGNKRPRIRR